ncbi:MAG: ChbG/HpnK family deacetylase [Janthinobacterium lividum]
MKTLTLCADDFAQSPAISASILDLLAAGRLSATSVFSLSPYWREGATALARHGGNADIGLHFNLSHRFGAAAADSPADGALAPRPLSYWLLRSQLQRLSWDELYDEMMFQIDAFADAMGRLPDFIDGHQHVHAFPLIRNVLTEVIRQRWRVNEEPYVRAPDRLMHAGDDAFKARVLRFACRDFSWHLELCGIDYPRWFGGFYSLAASVDYGVLMQAWLAAYPDGSLLMCHPGAAVGLDSQQADDPIAAARANEAAYLGSAAFKTQLDALGIQLGRFARS